MTEYPEYNPLDDMEQLPALSELEQLQEDYSELREKAKKYLSDLRLLYQFEELFRTFGSLTYEEQTAKNNILNNYKK